MTDSMSKYRVAVSQKTLELMRDIYTYYYRPAYEYWETIEKHGGVYANANYKQNGGNMNAIIDQKKDDARNCKWCSDGISHYHHADCPKTTVVIDHQVAFQNKQAANSTIALEKSRLALYSCLGAVSPANQSVRADIHAAIEAIEAV